MANIKKIYLSSDIDLDHEMTMFCNQDSKIYIEINTNSFPPSYITLDKSTAVQFVKDLKREISKIGGCNGDI